MREQKHKKWENPWTKVVLVSISQCLRKEMELDTLLSFLGGNLPPNPREWVNTPPWSPWLAHMDLLVNDLDEEVIQGFLEENDIPMSSLIQLYWSLPELLQNSTYLPGKSCENP